MNIHAVHHAKGDTNRFCGPSAISIITGMASGEAARLIRHITGKASVMGTSTSSIRRALEMCGVMSKPVYVVERPTLAQWLKDTVQRRSAGRVYLLVARNHWQVITGRRYCCGQTGEIISITDKRCRKRARVTEVYELTAKTITVPAAARKGIRKTTSEDRSRAEFRNVCAAYRMTYSRSGDDYVYIDPCDEFPDGLSFLFDGWSDAVEMVYRGLRHPNEIVEGYLTH